MSLTPQFIGVLVRVTPESDEVTVLGTTVYEEVVSEWEEEIDLAGIQHQHVLFKELYW